jgi:hypothetical protein
MVDIVTSAIGITRHLFFERVFEVFGERRPQVTCAVSE